MTIWADFEALKSLRGEPYTEQRERILASTPDLRSRLALREKTASWEDAIEAKILLGWLDHRATYEGLARDLDSEDPAAAQRTVLGLNSIWNSYAHHAAKDLKEVALPPSWEAILHHADELPVWKIVTYLRMIGAVPHPLSVEPLLRYIERAATPALRQTAVDTLAQLPRTAAESRAREEQARHEEAGRMLDGFLKRAP